MRIVFAASLLVGSVMLSGCFWHHEQTAYVQPPPPPHPYYPPPLLVPNSDFQIFHHPY